MKVLSPFTVDHAIYARDALAKAIYGQTFTWLVNRINDSMENKVKSGNLAQIIKSYASTDFFFLNFIRILQGRL